MIKRNFAAALIILLGLMALSATQFEVQAQKRDERRARALTNEANLLYRQKQYRQAADKYAEAISFSSKNPDAYFGKGNAHHFLNEFGEAKSAFDMAFNQGFKPLEIYRIRWYANYQLGNYDAAMRDVQAGLQLTPNDDYLMLALADVYRAQKNYRDALIAYKKAAERNPNNADVHYFIALTNYNMGNYLDQGFAALEAIKKNTQYPGDSWFYVGDALQKGKKNDDAIEAYERAIIANTKIYETYNNLSSLYQSQNRMKEAIATVQKGLSIYPNDGLLYTNLAWYYSLNDQHGEAIRAGQRAVQLAPNEYMGYTNLCRAYNDTKQYQLAIRTCEQALQLNPGDGESNYYIGRAYAFLNKKNEAAQYYQKAVDGLIQFTRNNPEYADGFYLLGNAYYSNEQIDEAVVAYRRVLELNPRFSKARYNLGYMYHLKGDKRSAEQQVSELMKIDPDLGGKLRAAIAN